MREHVGDKTRGEDLKRRQAGRKCDISSRRAPKPPPSADSIPQEERFEMYTSLRDKALT